MLTKEEYTYLNGFRPILDLFFNTGEYVGGADGVFDWHEKKYGQTIDRGCSGCKAGFLKLTRSLLIKYEENV